MPGHKGADLVILAGNGRKGGETTAPARGKQTRPIGENIRLGQTRSLKGQSGEACQCPLSLGSVTSLKDLLEACGSTDVLKGKTTPEAVLDAAFCTTESTGAPNTLMHVAQSVPQGRLLHLTAVNHRQPHQEWVTVMEALESPLWWRVGRIQVAATRR